MDDDGKKYKNRPFRDRLGYFVILKGKKIFK